MNKIEEYLDEFTSKNTIKAYRTHLTQYFDMINKDPDTYFKKTKKINEYKEDVRTFWKTQTTRPPLTRHAALSCIKSFLNYNLEKYDKEIPGLFSKGLKSHVQGKRAITKVHVPEPQEMRNILQHADLKGRALFLMSCSSGMRIDELLKLKETDIEFNHEPVKINVRAETTKTKEDRRTYCSNESVEALKAWLLVRNKYLKGAVDKCNRQKEVICFKDINDDTIFCFSYGVARSMWNRLIEKSGYARRDGSTKRRVTTIHSLRKYFRVYLSPKATADVTEVLMGHFDSLGNTYRAYPEKVLAEHYLKGMNDVSVFGQAPDLTIVNEQMDKVTRENRQIEQEIHELRTMISEIGNKKLKELKEMEKV